MRTICYIDIESEAELLRDLDRHLKNLSSIGIDLEDVKVRLPLSEESRRKAIFDKGSEIIALAKSRYSIPKKVTQQQLDKYKKEST
jgi:hypothetical protein